MKKLITIFIVGILVILGTWAFNSKRNVVDTDAGVNLCYYYTKDNANGVADRAWLKMNIKDTVVTGEFRNLPAETDSNIGRFEGTVGELDQASMSRTVEAIWDSLAEGMQNKEELTIKFGDGSAVAFFGEKIDRGDGVYVYKDKNALIPSNTMWQKDCMDLQEMLVVEDYIRQNIVNIATNNAVLGGTWYVVKLNISTFENTGTVIYEDGHVQSQATFSYDFNGENDLVVISNFSIKE